MAMMSSGSSTTQIMLPSRVLSAQIEHRSFSEILKQVSQNLIFSFKFFRLSARLFFFSLSYFHKYKTSLSASLGPMEGREEKWSMSFWKDLGNIIKMSND